MSEENQNETQSVEETSSTPSSEDHPNPEDEIYEDDSDSEDDYSELPDEDFEDNASSTPSVGVQGGMNVTDAQLAHYNTQVDEEAVKAIRAEWRKKKWFGARKLSPISAFLMVGVCAFIPWYIWGQRQDLAYFFSSSEPIDLGIAQDYHLVSEGEQAKAEHFEDNRYVRIEGIPIRHVGIQVSEIPLFPKKKKLVYQLMGSTVYIQEDMENSRFASFMAQTSPTLNQNMGVEQIEIKGRLRRFDSVDDKRYSAVRGHYTDKYGTIFCQGMSDAERKRKAALLGRGGVAVQIMPDDSVIQAETSTHVTLTDVQPLSGRSAMAIGADNTILHTIDAGLTWRKADLPISTQVTSIAYDPASKQIIFGGINGWVGGEAYKPAENALAISQDVLDVAFTRPEQGDVNAPRVISVGREGLLQVAYINREGWLPAKLDADTTFHDIMHVGDLWFAAGDGLMHKHAADAAWTHDVPPVKGQWFGLTQIPGAVIAVGSNGSIAKYALDGEQNQWVTWQSDDVPGIDYEVDLHASAISDDGKIWVGVGSNGSIVVARADENGIWGQVQRISGPYASYGVVRDILAGNSVEQALYEAVKRHTTEDLFDVTYHNGQFYAVGSESTLLTSQDGLSWQARPLHVPHKILRTIAFTNEKSGIIAGEKGTMLVTEDNGETWRTKKAPTERSIYDIDISPEFPNGFVFAGAYGLWGFCEGVDGRCYLRSRNDDFHYRAIAFNTGDQKAGYLHVVAAGDSSHIDQIDDGPNDSGIKTSIVPANRSIVYDMAFASMELPLMPEAARGQLGLVSVGDGSVYRSLDGGYTFHREETGLTLPVKKLVISQNGDIAWGFDKTGNAVEDIHGLGKWKRMAQPFIDGALTQTVGYLIDQKCVYRKMPQTEPEKITCLTDDAQRLTDITTQDGKIYLGMRAQDQMTWAELTSDQIATKGQIVAPNPEIPASASLIVCNQTPMLWDAENHKLYTDQGVQENVADVRCQSQKPVILTSKAQDKGTWLLGTSDWQMNVGFDTTFARMNSNASGKIWIAVENPGSQEPLILMSTDGKKWSWRRDRITDFHAVASSGQYAVAVGDNSTILVSEDYGASWHQSSAKSQQTLRDVCLSSDGSFALAVGDAGTIYRAQNGITHWSKLKYKLDFDITSCTIAEQKDRFDIYFVGKGGAIYKTSQNMDKLELIASPVMEDIYSIATLDTGEVIAVGGVYQSPDTICEEGYIIEADETPHGRWLKLVWVILLALFWIYTIRMFILCLTYKEQADPEPSEQ